MAHQQQTGPFDDPTNPFQDPSIANALNSQQHERVYDFAENIKSTAKADDFSGTSYQQLSSAHDPYAVQQPSNIATPAANTLAAVPEVLNSREEALRQKERELAERERALDERQRQTLRPGANNFPPCFPIMYLNIPVEIPIQHQPVVWWLYREWLLFELTLVLNFIACLCVLVNHPASITSAPTDMGVSITELFTHTVASFFLWYRPVYNAYMKDTSLYYFFFFIFNGFHILYTFYMAIGIPSTGGAGLILLVTLFSEQYYISGVFTLFATICWIVMGFMALFLYKKTYDQYKASGHTFKEAKQEALFKIGRSDAARDTAVNMAWHGATQSV
ncbi:scamp family-domain-containing protein [Spinellus fusiger]|nr:scamp family-domain-containing protein [Spinellus fusiger]